MTELARNVRLEMDAWELLWELDRGSVQTAFFDPQYRGDLDRKKYGNEKTGKGRRRASLPQMDEDTIAGLCEGLERVLEPSGHLFLWTNMVRLVDGSAVHPARHAGLVPVDMITWDKGRMGMGYRSRRSSEFCVVLQKPPVRAKGRWHDRALRDVWTEKVDTRRHPHRKPVGLLERLIEATTREGDLVVDPAAGSFAVLEACEATGRDFIGGDILGQGERS